MHHRPISFPQWKQVLASSALSPQLKAAYTREILSFLRHCKAGHEAATVEVAKNYLAWREKQSPEPSPSTGSGQAREALRWFYREGRKTENAVREEGPPSDEPSTGLRAPRLQVQEQDRDGPVRQARGKDVPAPGFRRPMEPPPAAQDLGGPPWERDLIRTCRERGHLWRTEQTYREWAVRFARFIAPRSPHVAAGGDVAAFLSALAVEGRASPSSQKQALNALVFLMQEALHRDLGEMEFRRAHPKQRAPTVLSVAEAKSLFAQMSGTPRLMAELAYGAGLRLMELLRLRIHHLDFDRGRLQVFAGKGDKDRVTVLPERLIPELKAHFARLHELWQADRTAKVPGSGCRTDWTGSIRRRVRAGSGNGCSFRAN
jgi:hypothetical protein